MRPPLICLLLHLGVAGSAWWNPLPSQPSSSEQEFDQVSGDEVVGHQHRVPFEMGESSPGDRSLQLLSELKTRLGSSCWHAGYLSLASSCREVLKDEEMKMRMAYMFTDCFLRSSGKKPLKPCSDSVPVKQCTKVLDDHRSSILVQYFIDVASICHHIQSEAFKLETEEVVANLQTSAHWLENRLTEMQNQARTILENTEKIFGSQQRLEDEYQEVQHKVAGMHEDINKGISHLREYTHEANKQMETISHFQKDMANEQENLVKQQQALSENLREEVSSLKSRADDINSNVIQSLTGQEELLAGQNDALTTLSSLQKLQDELLEESKTLQRIHQRLAKSSSDILSAQEGFASKQTLMFTSLEKLFSLHDALLTESRTMKAVLFYAPVAILVYFLTGTKQTCNARAILYFGLCLAFGAEFWSLRLIRFTPFYNYEIFRNVLWIRGTYAVAALSYIFYCMLTFKDYACLSYKLLVDVAHMQKKLAQEQIVFRPESCVESMSDVETEEEFCIESEDVPSFLSYEDEWDKKRPDAKDLDPDYSPEDVFDSGCIRRFKSDYNFRWNARESGRRLARSAGILSWETEEMFTSLFRPVVPR